MPGRTSKYLSDRDPLWQVGKGAAQLVLSCLRGVVSGLDGAMTVPEGIDRAPFILGERAETVRQPVPAAQAQPRPLLFFVGSTFTHFWPGLGGGGRRCPFGTVTSLPPPVGRYCPDVGAGLPGDVALRAM